MADRSDTTDPVYEDLASTQEQRLERARSQIERMQNFLCERGLYQDYMTWMESHVRIHERERGAEIPHRRGAGTLSVEDTIDRIKVMIPQRARSAPTDENLERYPIATRLLWFVVGAVVAAITAMVWINAHV